MKFLDRAAVSTVIPFTPATYDDAFARPPLRTLPVRSEGIPIVYICTHVVSEDIAKVALHVFEDLGVDAEGRPQGKLKAPDHEWYAPLHHQANEYQTAIDFREMMTAWALNRGRGVARKVKRRVGGRTIRELEPLHPDLVLHELTADGERWRYFNPRKRQDEFLLPDEVFVLWGPRRQSVISYLRELLETMNTGQGARRSMYDKGMRHAGVIQRPKDAPRWTDTAQKNFREAVDDYMAGGERAGRPLLLQDGMTWVNSSLSLADTEWVSSQQLDNALVCGAYRVPQHKAGLLERSTNNNISQQAVDYVVDCLLAWAVRWEQAIRMQLLMDPFKAEHNLRTLLRGDPKTAAETHAVYYAIGAETGNEVRDDEGRNPIEGLDEPRVPLNMDVPGVSVAYAPQPRLTAGPEPKVIELAHEHRLALIRDGVARVLRKEHQALSKVAERTGGAGDEWEREVRAFYRDHTEFTAKVLQIGEPKAEAYTRARSAAVAADPELLVDLEDAADNLTAIALGTAREGVAA